MSSMYFRIPGAGFVLHLDQTYFFDDLGKETASVEEASQQPRQTHLMACSCSRILGPLYS